MKIISFVIAVWIAALSAEASEVQIYRGEPFTEALHDVVLSGAVEISHQLSKASSMERTDVFKLRDGRMLVILSVSAHLGEPYTIKEISLGPLGNDTKTLKLLSSLKLPSLAGSTKLEDKFMKPTHDEIVKWMNEYFAEYNASAQDAKTVHRLDTYFAPDLTFIPYMYVFGGPKSAITSREAFYTMLTNHPSDYEKFIIHDVFVDEKRLVSVAFLEATIFETATNKIKVKKNYLPLYELKLDDKGSLKISTIRFFWEALPPEVDGAAYAVDKSKWGK